MYIILLLTRQVLRCTATRLRRRQRAGLRACAVEDRDVCECARVCMNGARHVVCGQAAAVAAAPASPAQQKRRARSLATVTLRDANVYAVAVYSKHARDLRTV